VVNIISGVFSYYFGKYYKLEIQAENLWSFRPVLTNLWQRREDELFISII
jgi:hypothetical protein